MIEIRPARRTEGVREYYFSLKNKEMARLNAERDARGEDRIVNLGIGSPNGMPPAPAIQKLVETAQLPGQHGYQNYTGNPELRGAFASWYKRYYGVELDPAVEIQPLVGSKEGILLTSLAYLNPGDKVLVPDPGYPTYSSATRLAEAEIVTYNLTEENGWMPSFDELESLDPDGIKLMWINYPHMPTGTKATPELYRRIVDFALRHNILVVNDNPYSFILCDKPLSILSIPGAKECCLEMNSLSKAHNMAGWRIGMIAGDSSLIAEVLKVKSQMDSGMFKALQMAAIEALSSGPEWFEALNAEYRRRLSVVHRIFDALDLRYNPDSAGLFVWGRIPEDQPLIREYAVGKSLGERLSDRLLYDAGVFMAPGIVFGRGGSDYIRCSLCADIPVLEDALKKILNLQGC